VNPSKVITTDLLQLNWHIERTELITERVLLTLEISTKSMHGMQYDYSCLQTF